MASHINIGPALVIIGHQPCNYFSYCSSATLVAFSTITCDSINTNTDMDSGTGIPAVLMAGDRDEDADVDEFYQLVRADLEKSQHG